MPPAPAPPRPLACPAGELLAALAGSFPRLNLVGADIVEVAPAYDTPRSRGSPAVHVGYELLSSLAAQKAG